MTSQELPQRLQLLLGCTAETGGQNFPRFTLCAGKVATTRPGKPIPKDQAYRASAPA